MGWIALIAGCLLTWAGWDALVSIGTVRPLTKREVTESVMGEGAPLMSEAGESYARTRMLIQPTSLAQLLAAVFLVVGVALVVGAIWHLLPI